MNAKQNRTSIEQQINAVNLSQYERKAVLNDAHIAELFVGTIEWVCGKLARPSAQVFAKPSPKY